MPVTVNAKQLREILECINPGGPDDEFECETEITLFNDRDCYMHPTPRDYWYYSEYPEEGCVQIS